jgi:hypothetical protein
MSETIRNKLHDDERREPRSPKDRPNITFKSLSGRVRAANRGQY